MMPYNRMVLLTAISPLHTAVRILIFIIYEFHCFRNTSLIFLFAFSSKKNFIFLKNLLAFFDSFCYHTIRAYMNARITQQQGGATDGKVRVLR